MEDNKQSEFFEGFDNHFDLFKLDLYRKDWYNPAVWFSNLKLWFRKLKWMHQRIKHGCCDLDAWNTDFSILRYLYVILKMLGKSPSGFHYIKDGLSDEDAYDLWVRYINDAAEHFKYAAIDDLDFTVGENIDQYNKVFKQRKFNISKYDINNTHSRTDLIWDFKMGELKKGFNKLRENFFALWD